MLFGLLCSPGCLSAAIFCVTAGTRMGQDDEQNVNDPALHAVDAELASKPVPPKQGEASYGDHYHTRSSEEGFGKRRPVAI